MALRLGNMFWLNIQKGTPNNGWKSMKTDCLVSEKTYRDTIEKLRISLINRMATKSRERVIATDIILPICPTCGQILPDENHRVRKEKITDAISNMANRLAKEQRGE